MNIVQFAGGTFVDSENFSNRATIDPAPVAEITGNASVDEGAADGVAENNVTFIALDADGQGCATYLEFTSDSGSAILGAETAMTDYDTGEVTISLTDTVGEVVTVTAKQAGGDVTGVAETTFVAVDDGAGLEGFRAKRAGKNRVTTGDWPRNNETEDERKQRLDREERDKESLKKREDETDEQYRTRLQKDKDARRPPQSGGRANPSSPASGTRDKSQLPADIDPSVNVKRSPPAAGSLEGKDTPPPATTKPAPKASS
jgi:hypothetical protein